MKQSDKQVVGSFQASKKRFRPYHIEAGRGQNIPHELYTLRGLAYSKDCRCPRQNLRMFRWYSRYCDAAEQGLYRLR